MTQPVDYNAILDAIEQIISEDPELGDVSVLVEEELTFQSGSIVIIYLDRDDNVEGEQALTAGTRDRKQIFFSIWCCHQGLNRRDAIRQRNWLKARVETALMRDRELKNTVEVSWSPGGEFMTVLLESGFMSCASINLVCETVAIV